MVDINVYGQLINAMGGGGDRGNAFPQSDADDFSNGANFIPSEVTQYRRNGQHVQFHQNCTKNCWYWEMPNGSRIYNFDRLTYDQMRGENEEAPKCVGCGNPHTSGGKHSSVNGSSENVT